MRILRPNEHIGWLVAFLTTFTHLPQTLLTVHPPGESGTSPGMHNGISVAVVAWLTYGQFLSA
ncbi:hypothetical protein LPB72_08820 [Hydrogenophaga crassostreae]|uniref:Uncharacterized protein n=1 Tax=Hydrogenophaga crassostreae TaxID=1763535 RepID=A0A162P806_9BURK|nr:hypothetical protein [Hydrogenophaga crassostreae]AOW11841.1 hypothetical protein LPB072_02130 [Hydrogenophaga crassostreae]OAD42311.1 hypothetical protein LPB72_08820 [Hydrogenophaga crassostreae]